MDGARTHPPGAVREVASVFLKLGFLGFGGPAAPIALIRDECVRRRAWIDEAVWFPADEVEAWLAGVPDGTLVSLVRPSDTVSLGSGSMTDDAVPRLLMFDADTDPNEIVAMLRAAAGLDNDVEDDDVDGDGDDE